MHKNGSSTFYGHTCVVIGGGRGRARRLGMCNWVQDRNYIFDSRGRAWGDGCVGCRGGQAKAKHADMRICAY